MGLPEFPHEGREEAGATVPCNDVGTQAGRGFGAAGEGGSSSRTSPRAELERGVGTVLSGLRGL